jgi:hypothetical protein
MWMWDAIYSTTIEYMKRLFGSNKYKMAVASTLSESENSYTSLRASCTSLVSDYNDSSNSMSF